MTIASAAAYQPKPVTNPIDIKIAVKRRIVVNGKEYASPDDLPPELRSAYERATSGVSESADPRPAAKLVEKDGVFVPGNAERAETEATRNVSFSINLHLGMRELLILAAIIVLVAVFGPGMVA